ncbi:MAG: 30S ribosomal protein S9 [Planctomycetota bacterium]|jgi:small subunit ribosomal protein S9
MSEFIWSTGRRKSSVARVRIKPGTGEIEINKRPFLQYFPTVDSQNSVLGPLRAIEAEGKWDVIVNVHGGGPTGQSGAVRLGISRCLKKADETLDHILREGGFLTRDARMKERKKYGQKGARGKFQFSKR